MLPAESLLTATEPERAAMLAFDPSQHPIAAQIGGSDPTKMAAAALLCARAGYDEVNINVGCPSPIVNHNDFGACLMKTPNRVAAIAIACIAALQAEPGTAHVALTVKHRLGVDEVTQLAKAADFTQHAPA
eukprot:SAG11_NODE_1685_length_4449_cov_4.411954_3_plen_131_part_00